MADLDKNDLKTIEGIGPAMEGKLKDTGINTVSDLAARTDPADVATLLASRGVDEERVRKWIAAATTPAGDVPPAEVVAAARIVTTDAVAQVNASIDPQAKPTPVTEPTLHQLNIQARSIDRQHKALRDRGDYSGGRSGQYRPQGYCQASPAPPVPEEPSAAGALSHDRNGYLQYGARYPKGAADCLAQRCAAHGGMAQA
ncbi:helix-hairpin-helix domain-containing protein [Devosia sp. A8/3-2]|nr:helix-hairpin-helix domain-containing protein [Devosia sp. A8/3-2]